MATDKHPILSRIEAHLEATGQTPTAFGVAAAGDPNFVFELRAGRDIRWKTARKIERHLDNIESGEAAA